jgi:hypothetical protein
MNCPNLSKLWQIKAIHFKPKFKPMKKLIFALLGIFIILTSCNEETRLIGIESAVIPPIDGQKILKDVVSSNAPYYDDLVLMLNFTSAATPRDTAIVYLVIRSSNIQQIFKTLDRDYASSCLTQAQIIEFCDEHKYLLEQEGAIFLLYQPKEKWYNIVFVRLRKNCLDYYVTILPSMEAKHYDECSFWGPGLTTFIVVRK